MSLFNTPEHDSQIEKLESGVARAYLIMWCLLTLAALGFVGCALGNSNTSYHIGICALVLLLLAAGQVIAIWAAKAKIAILVWKNNRTEEKQRRDDERVLATPVRCERCGTICPPQSVICRMCGHNVLSIVW